MTKILHSSRLLFKFQSTHLHEVWLLSPRTPATPACVSIHTPTWGVTSLFTVLASITSFQSTHLHEVWQFNSILSEGISEFQSTHLHEVWPLRAVIFCASKVSIHTPTWGVTRISVSFPFLCSFNPHTYMRCDFTFFWHFDHSSVSIHTPTWGVTLCWITYYQPASLINYYANRYYFFDFTTQNCSINKLIYWFLTPAKLLFFL